MFCWQTKPENKTHLEKNEVLITFFEPLDQVSPEAFTALGLLVVGTNKFPLCVKFPIQLEFLSFTIEKVLTALTFYLFNTLIRGMLPKDLIAVPR